MLDIDLIRPLADLVASHAAQYGDKMAFRDAERLVTYGQLYARTARLAGHLQDRGLTAGGRVILHLENSVETVEGYLGITRADGVGVCINPGASDSEVAAMVIDSGATIIITDLAHLDRARSLVTEAGLPLHVICTGDLTEVSDGGEVESFSELAATEPSQPARDSLPIDAPAWMVYTSGTTGRPKGVLLTQHNLLWMAAACWVPVTRFSKETYELCPLPMFHSYTLAVSVVGVMATGASEYILPRFTSKGVLRVLRTEPITFMPGVPTMFDYLLQEAKEVGLGSSTLEFCMSAGAIMSATLNREFEEAFKVPLLDGYGITETSTMVTMNWPTGSRVMGSCGLPLLGSAVRIVDPASGKDVEIGRDGELWVRGPHVMLGYHNRPDETARALAGGWYHTGDLGSCDANGYLTISGRTKEMIIRGGENIYPAEIENVLKALDSVRDAAAVGRPHPDLGEVPVAFVVPQDPGAFDPEVLFEACRVELAYYKVPVRIVVVTDIPRTGSGKIMRFKLVDPPSGTGATYEETLREGITHD